VTSRGGLLEILVCGKERDGQACAPDESEALSLLARSVGPAFDGLRQERHDDLKAAIDNLGVNVSDLRRGIAVIRDVVRVLTPSADGSLPNLDPFARQRVPCRRLLVAIELASSG
jgi:hypothetical protein